MPELKVACWNIYFSHNLISGSGGDYQVNDDERDRFNNVVQIIRDIDADLLGIVECMPSWKLRFLQQVYFPDYSILVEGRSKKLNLGLLYKAEKVEVTPLQYDRSRWQASIGYRGEADWYKFSRTPLVVGVRDRESDERFALSIVHMKSKKTYTPDRREPYNNRKKIVAQALRSREIMASLEASHSDYKRFIVIGDVNDGPGFDKYEAKLVVSGIESLLGTVFDPDEIYRSFSDLADGGIPTTPFRGAPQLDHILYSQSMERPRGARIVEGSGRVRNDLVNFQDGSGKTRDSDHAPVEIAVAT